MMPLPPPDWFLLFLAANLAVVFAAAVFYAVRRQRWLPRRRVAPFIFRCTVCGHVYLDRRNVPMAECEKCGAMNESVKSF